MKKILWITADYFADVDCVFDIMKRISKEFYITWIIFEGKQPYIPRDLYNVFSSLENINIDFIKNNYRTRDPRCLFSYLKILRKIQQLKPNIIYYNIAPNPASALISLFFNKKKTIYVAHDGKAQNDSSKFGFLRTLSYNLTFTFAKHFNMFSKSQAKLLYETYGKKDINVMRLPLKNLGEVSMQRPNNIIRFLSFGHIIYQKNIDLLIEAGNILFEKGFKQIRISINGTCENWNFYKEKIKHPEIFECNPSFISNEELLHLFGTSHYAVFPYRRVSQSGVLKLAFNYNIPVIASNIGAFKEEIIENINGFFFNVSDVNSLVDVMENLIRHHNDTYPLLINRMKKNISENYSLEKSANSYIHLFNSL